ncbi:MAG: hypothetical protein FH751_14475 [Firmicutes bacterium]|nr:hypothetical protein [Bacillota bacterium]
MLNKMTISSKKTLIIVFVLLALCISLAEYTTGITRVGGITLTGFVFSYIILLKVDKLLNEKKLNYDKRTQQIETIKSDFSNEVMDLKNELNKYANELSLKLDNQKEYTDILKEDLHNEITVIKENLMKEITVMGNKITDVNKELNHKYTNKMSSVEEKLTKMLNKNVNKIEETLLYLDEKFKKEINEINTSTNDNLNNIKLKNNEIKEIIESLALELEKGFEGREIQQENARKELSNIIFNITEDMKSEVKLIKKDTYEKLDFITKENTNIKKAINKNQIETRENINTIKNSFSKSINNSLEKLNNSISESNNILTNNLNDKIEVLSVDISKGFSQNRNRLDNKNNELHKMILDIEENILKDISKISGYINKEIFNAINYNKNKLALLESNYSENKNILHTFQEGIKNLDSRLEMYNSNINNIFKDLDRKIESKQISNQESITAFKKEMLSLKNKLDSFDGLISLTKMNNQKTLEEIRKIKKLEHKEQLLNVKQKDPNRQEIIEDKKNNAKLIEKYKNNKRYKSKLFIDGKLKYETIYDNGILYGSKSYNEHGNVTVSDEYYRNGAVKERIEYYNEKGKRKKEHIKYDRQGNEI